jgi:hypothetical protein
MEKKLISLIDGSRNCNTVHDEKSSRFWLKSLPPMKIMARGMLNYFQENCLQWVISFCSHDHRWVIKIMIQVRGGSWWRSSYHDAWWFLVLAAPEWAWMVGRRAHACTMLLICVGMWVWHGRSISWGHIDRSGKYVCGVYIWFCF